MRLKTISWGAAALVPSFWLDTDSLATPSRGPYRFPTVPRFWEFLEQKASEKIIASPEFVLNELIEGDDQLKEWAKRQQGTLFQAPNQAVQEMFRQIADSVNNSPRYAAHHVAEFLKGADPWVIAYAAALGGRVVTFERSEPTSRKPKIPDVGREFGVHCISLWDMLTELGASF